MTAAIVVLTDFFAVSNRALSYAAALAVPLEAHLVLLHVRHDGLLAPQEYAHRQAGRNLRATQQALHALAESQPVPTQIEISESFLPDAVAEAVRHHQPMLLVLGRPGTATAPAEVISSAAMDLLRQAPYPLLIVPTVGWDAAPPRRLVLAVDGAPFALCDNHLIVLRLLEKLNCTLKIVHVTDKRGTKHEAPHILYTVQAGGMADHLTTDQVSVVPGLAPVAGILQACSDFNGDLIVLVARRHNLLSSLFHRSVTAQLLSESPVPVLLLPSLD